MIPFKNKLFYFSVIKKNIFEVIGLICLCKCPFKGQTPYTIVFSNIVHIQKLSQSKLLTGGVCRYVHKKVVEHELYPGCDRHGQSNQRHFATPAEALKDRDGGQ